MIELRRGKLRQRVCPFKAQKGANAIIEISQARCLRVGDWIWDRSSSACLWASGCYVWHPV